MSTSLSPTFLLPTGTIVITCAGQTISQMLHPVHLTGSMSSFPLNLSVTTCLAERILHRDWASPAQP